MPIEMGIWRLGGELERLEYSALESEARLQDVLVKDLSVVSPQLMRIGDKVRTDHGKEIDILAIDAEGTITILELKRDKTPREVVAQAIDYASWVQGLSYADIADIFKQKNNGKAFEEAFDEHFGQSPPEEINERHEMVIIAAELDAGTERIINYLSENHEVPINAVFFRYFRDGNSEYLTRTWLVDPVEAEANIEKSTTKKAKTREPWNGRDFYVSFGDPENRVWEDAIKYGFISAGGGKWYSQTLYNLEPGHRIWVNIPPKRYAGVGEVVERAKPMRDFKVEVDGSPVPIADAPMRSKYHTGNLDDDDMCEHFVRVRWIRTVPIDKGYWETAFFANQASACKLRNRFTLNKLLDHFEVEE